MNAVERRAVEVMAAVMRPAETLRELHKRPCLRLIRVGIDPDTVLHFGMVLDHLEVRDRKYHPQEIAMAVVTWSPNAFPKRLRRYLEALRAQLLAIIGAEIRAEAREWNYALWLQTGDPDLLN